MNFLSTENQRYAQNVAKYDQYLDVRNSYLGGRTRTSDVERLRDLTEPKGFVLKIDDNGDAIESIDWASKEQDFLILDQVLARIVDFFPVNISDKTATAEGGHDQAMSEIGILLLGDDKESVKNGGSELFRRMHDDQIERNVGHDLDPFDHTMQVIKSLTSNFTDLAQIEKVWLTFSAVVHDIGKLCIAKDDRYHDHAEISYLVAREWIRSRLALVSQFGINENNLEYYLGIVRYHHALELVDKDQIITYEEFAALAQTEHAMKLLGIFAFADASSIGNRYVEFAVANVIQCVSSLEQIEMNKENSLRLDVRTFAREILAVVKDFLRQLMNVLSFEELVKSYQRLLDGIQQLDSLQGISDQILAEISIEMVLLRDQNQPQVVAAK